MPLTDCTDKRAPRPIQLMRARTLSGLMAVVAILTVVASGWLSAGARADGDPASDVLAAQSLFLPQDAGVPAGEQAQLAALLASAGREGFQIRAALIASPSDLGSIGELWRQPQTYAHFLGQELSVVYRGTLLVVMPNGLGVYGVGDVRLNPSALHGLAPPGADLGPAAIGAIRRLAAAAGHVLALPRPVSVSASGSDGAIPWLVFGLGVVLIVLAWTASLRSRPLGSRGPTSPP